MAATKITSLTSISTIDTAVDPLPIVDVSDTSQSASGTTKKVTVDQIESSIFGATGSKAIVVDNVAALKALTVASVDDGQLFLTRGYYSDNDGGQGTYIYDAASSSSDNGGTVIAPTSGAGRYLLQYSGPINVKQFGAKGDGVQNDSTYINNAIASLSSGGKVVFANGTYYVTSQIVVSTGVELVGNGISTSNGLGSSHRGASCILRGFTGSSATVALNGDSSGIDNIDVDGNLQGTGDQVQVWGSRIKIGSLSTRNSGNDGVRIGKTDAGPSTINANFWYIKRLVTYGNSGNGIRIDDTNTSTTSSYPLGLANVNGGIAELIDSIGNAGDGVQIGNANDNVFVNIGSQSNQGIGIHFKTDGTNSGPRCNTILGNDSEGNTGNDIQIDAATLPVSGPGLYNRIFGNRSVALNSRIVNNSSGSLVLQWNPNMSNAGYSLGKSVSAYNTSGDASFDGYAGVNASPARIIAKADGTTGSKWEIWTKKDAGSLLLRSYWLGNGTYVHNPTGGNNGDGILISKSVANTTTPGIQIGDGGAGGYYTRVNMVGDGTGSDTKFAFYNSNGQTGTIVTSGTATAYNTSSDYRLKKNIVLADGAKSLESVMSWPIVSFNWIADEKQDIGVIAHELQALKPSAVSGQKDAMRNGEIDPQGVDYSKLIPELVSAVQYLSKKITSLESR